MSSKGTIFARPGERVTDEHGKTVCFVKNPLRRQHIAKVDDFEGWTVPKPHKGDDMRLTPGFRMLNDGRPQVHVAGEWKP
jgi:hypothetical protein